MLPLLGAGKAAREGVENPQGPTAKAERPEEAEHLENEWNAMRMEGGEDPLAGMGMDAAEETLPGIPANAGGSSRRNKQPRGGARDLGTKVLFLELRQNSHSEGERLVQNVPGKKLGLPQGWQQISASAGEDSNRR